jgi:hypothetical protein
VDDREARLVLQKELTCFRELRFDTLMPLVGTSLQVTRKGDSGREYQIEIEIRWDTELHKAIRVFGAIDDGRGYQAIFPLCDDFLVQP